ncbi:MAG: Calx-beta domain-containing protein [Limisphaerales bacterium]
MTTPPPKDCFEDGEPAELLTRSRPSRPWGRLREVFLGLLWIGGTAQGAQVGQPDPDFGPGLAPDQSVLAVVVQPDQKLIVGGDFTTLGSGPGVRIARLHSDGTVDRSFDVDTGANASVRALAVQSDGKVLVAGAFSQLRGENQNRIARLNPNGTLDPGFSAGDGPNGEVFAIALQPDQRIVVAGSFTTVGGQPRNYLARLRTNGTLDPDFNPSANNVVRSLALESDGRLVFGGDFTQVGTRVRNRVGRLLANGALDEAFDPGQGPNSTVFEVALPGDGSVLLGGAFTEIHGSPRQYVGRLTPGGLPDVDFGPVANSVVYAMARQSDGRIVIGGEFSQVDGVPATRLARLQKDGALDPSFNPGTGANAAVQALAVQLDGDVVLGGSFTDIAGQPRARLGRVQGVSSAGGGELEFAAARYRVTEGQANAQIEIRRSGTTSQAVTVSYATSNGTANAGDYTGQAGVLNFGAGITSQTFAIPLKDDGTVEEDETVILTLSEPGGGAELGGQRTAVLVIGNDDTSVSAGRVDSGFESTAAGAVHAIATQPDGKIVVGGTFHRLGGESRLRLGRLRADGSVDPAFLPTAWVNSTVHALAVQPDGRILAGGSFTLANGITRNRLARFREDGALDPTFDPGLGPNSTVYALKVQPDGDILVGGSFSQYAGENRTYLLRVFSDGSLDPGYRVELNAGVQALLLLSDGRLVAGGDFTLVGDRTRNRLARFLANGTLDESFDPASGPNSTVFALAFDGGGNVLAGGAFSEMNGTPSRYLARLVDSGLPDLGFVAEANNAVYALGVQPDGKVLAGGDFTLVNGDPVQRIVRLRADGSSDPGFDSGTGANGTVLALAPQLNGKVVVGGRFSEFDGLNLESLLSVNGISPAVGGELEFASAEFRISEGQSRILIEVRRTGGSSETVTVNFATSNGTATAGDYIGQSGRLTFAPGVTSQTFPVPIRSDPQIEDEETVNLALSSPTGGAELGGLRTATLVIEDDDASQNVGEVDAGFRAWTDRAIHATAIQPDGKVVVAGEFSRLSGVSRLRIGRVNADGTPDPTFNPGAWLDGVVSAVVVQEDGRILVGGAFTKANGEARRGLARFLPDGTLDPTLDPGTGPNGQVFALALLAEGDLLVGGTFTQFGGEPRPYLVRLYGDGTVDPGYRVELNSTVRSIAHLGDGGAVVGGNFTLVGARPRNRVARLDAKGALVEAFDPGLGPNSTVHAIVLDGGGGVVIGGSFSDVNGSGRRYLCRLDARGLPDLGFRVDLDNAVYSVARQADGLWVVGGEFTRVDGVSRNRLARLLPDGNPDEGFETGSGANGPVHAVAIELDGSILAAGDFTQFNGRDRSRMVRVHGVSAAGGGEIVFSAARYEVSENQPSVTIEVRRIGTTTEAVSVEYSTANGTANAGDYVGQSATLVFGAGEVSRTFLVPIRQDTTVEDEETVLLTLSNPGGGAGLGGQRTATLFIRDDDRNTVIGGVDTTFAGRASGPVHAMAEQADGRVVVVGDFSELSGQARFRIGRLNVDGTLDATFQPGAWLNGPGYAVVIQSDGRILVGGAFSEANGVPRNRLARFLANGSLDPTFDPGVGPNSTVFALAIQSEGDILVGGSFSTFAGVARAYLARVFPDGNLDPGLNPQMNGTVYALGISADARFFAGGDFTSVFGVTRNRIARFQPGGALDEGFDPVGGPNATVRVLVAEPDGGVLMGGSFSDVNGTGRRSLARLGIDGLPVATFEASLNGAVHALMRRNDGRVVAGGDFTQASGRAAGRLVRLLTDGAVDPDFALGLGADATVHSVLGQSDGNVIVGGLFTQFDGLDRSRLARLLATDGGPVAPFQFTTVAAEPRGIVLTGTGQPGQSYVLEYSRDYSRWFVLGTNSSATSTIEFVDPNPTDSHRIFRIRSQP